MNRAARLAKYQSAQVQKSFLERQIKRRAAAVEELASTGAYESYNAETGLHQVTTAAGTVGVRSITNAGLETGEPVVLNLRAGVLKTMPR